MRAVATLPASLGVMLCAATAAAAPDFDDPAVRSVEDLDHGARRVVIERDRTWGVSIGTGETLENLLIDIDRPGANVRITASGTGWTIRNIGVEGAIKRDAHAITLSGRDGVVDTVYLGDGALARTRSIGVFVNHNSSSTIGPIDFHRMHIAGFPNNGIYGSPTVEELSGAVVNIRDSYFDTNNIANFKLGSPRGPCRVIRTVVRTDGTATPYQNGAVNARALWALDNPGGDHPDKHRIIVEDSDIQGRIVSEPGAIIELRDTRFDGRFDPGGDPHESGDPPGQLIGESVGEPDLSPPAGVPMTALEAATGQAQGPDPQPELGTVVAARTDGSIAIDGALDEPAWATATPLVFSDRAQTSDNEVDVRALWDASALYLGWSVHDGTIESDATAPPYHEDGVEMFLDPTQNGGQSIQPDDVHVVYSIAERLVADLGQQDFSNTEGLERAVVTGTGEYRVELRVPWAALGINAAAGLEMGALLANNDLDESAIRQFSASGVSPFTTPDAWRTLRLADAGSPGTGPDAGTHAPGPDAGPGGAGGSPEPGDGSPSAAGGCRAAASGADGLGLALLLAMSLLVVGRRRSGL